jgi:hypothetical protein
MANAKSLARAAEAKTPRKDSASATRKDVPVGAHVDARTTAPGATPAQNVVRAVMAAPPPSGLPFMPPGKVPRVADRPKVANRTVKKRAASGAAA